LYSRRLFFYLALSAGKL